MIMKTYIKPNTEMHAIELQSMIAATTLQVNTEEKVTEVTEIESKETSFGSTSVWDEVKLLLGLAAVGRRRQTATKLYATKVATALIKVCLN